MRWYGRTVHDWMPVHLCLVSRYVLPVGSACVNALSMVRQLEWSEAAGTLISAPLPEYSSLRNATLLVEPSMPLSPGKWSPSLKLKGDPSAGAAAEIALTVALPGNGPASVGVVVLAPAEASAADIAGSAVIWLNVSAPSSVGGPRHATLSLANKHAPPTRRRAAFASQSFTVGAAEREVDLSIFVDRCATS